MFPWSLDQWICGVENHIEFSNRIRSYNFDDDNPNFNWNDKEMIEDHYFTIDFTLKELRTLKRNQTSPTRDPYYNRRCSFNSFDEFVITWFWHLDEIKISICIEQNLEGSKLWNYSSKNGHWFLERTWLHWSQCQVSLTKFELSILEEIKDQTKVNCVFLLAKTDEETLKWARNLNAKWQNWI